MPPIQSGATHDTLEEGESNAENIPQSVFIIVMGVSGTGKSTLGAALAKVLDLPFLEGDELHPKANVDKMSAGIPLNDADREPWLELIRTTAERIANQQTSETSSSGGAKRIRGVVAGCSALKGYYRDILRGRRKPASTERGTLPNELEAPHPDVLPTYFVFIDGPRELLQERIEKRPGHFFKASMLDSQLDTLGNPSGEEGVITVSLRSSTEEQVAIAKRGLIGFIGTEL